MFHVLTASGFDVATRNHAQAILAGDFADEVSGLVGALLGFSVPARELIKSGGGQAASTMRLRDALYAQGWRKHKFVVQTIVDGTEREATSHEMDHVKNCPNGTLALEIEWNNKDPFFDRDLENFQRLHAQGAISLGVLVTRGSSLQAAMTRIVASTIRREGIVDASELKSWGMKERTERQMTTLAALIEKQVPFAEAFAQSFVADKFGAATTHWSKLDDRIKRGVGNPCPLLLIGLPLSAVSDYSAASPEL
ncbi:MAG: BglII/BstYI family type II restriction endonuclease [Paracoccaceae bacterium]